MQHTKVTDVSDKLNWENKTPNTKSKKQETPVKEKSTPMDKPMPSQKEMMEKANATKKPKKVEKYAV